MKTAQRGGTTLPCSEKSLSNIHSFKQKLPTISSLKILFFRLKTHFKFKRRKFTRGFLDIEQRIFGISLRC